MKDCRKLSQPNHWNGNCKIRFFSRLIFVKNKVQRHKPKEVKKACNHTVEVLWEAMSGACTSCELCGRVPPIKSVKPLAELSCDARRHKHNTPDHSMIAYLLYSLRRMSWFIGAMSRSIARAK